MMKKHLYLWALIGSLGIFSSCYKDHSTDPSRALSIISDPTDGTALAQQYKGTFGTDFVLSAPNVQQSNEQLPLAYRWEVYQPSSSADVQSPLPTNYTGRELRLPLNAFGLYRINLHITNADNAYIRSFEVLVENNFELGIYALLDQAGKPEFAYIPASGYVASDEENTFKTGLQRTNPIGSSFRGFSGNPTSFSIYTESNRRTYFELATDNGGMYQINASTMAVTANLTNVTIQAPSYLYSSGAGGYSGFAGVVRNGLYYSRLQDGSYLRLQNQQQKITLDYPNTSFADQAAVTTQGVALYDKTSSSVFFLPRTGFTRFEPTATNLQSAANLSKWRGSELISAASYDARARLALLLKSSASTYFIARLQPTGNASSPAQFLGLIDVPSTLSPNDQMRIAGGSSDVLFLSSGQQVYTYIASSTAFHTTPLVSLSGSEQIVQVLPAEVDRQSRLYVATTDGTTSSIYCYVLSEGLASATLQWSKTGISGKLIQLGYRATR